MYFINNVFDKVKKILLQAMIYIFLFTLATKSYVNLCTALILGSNHFQTLGKYFVFVVIMP